MKVYNRALDEQEINTLFGGLPPAVEDIVPDAQEYQALIDLYNSLNGPGWTSNTNWTNTDLPLSAWHGVTVVNGDVTEINLPSNNLRGTIPRSIHLLEALKVINFGTNQVKGELPVQLARLPELEALYLNDNELGGVIDLEFSVMPKLTTIHLQNNNFRSIPDYSFKDEVDKGQVTLKAENNKLEFLYIENNLDLSTPLQSFTYVPQKPYGEPKIMGFIAGNKMELKVKMLGSANVYQWEYNGGSGWTTIGTNSPNYEKTSVALTDAGRYRCRISNTIEGTGFEIVMEEIEVKVDGGITTEIGGVSVINRPEN